MYNALVIMYVDGAQTAPVSSGRLHCQWNNAHAYAYIASWYAVWGLYVYLQVQ